MPPGTGEIFRDVPPTHSENDVIYEITFTSFNTLNDTWYKQTLSIAGFCVQILFTCLAFGSRYLGLSLET